MESGTLAVASGVIGVGATSFLPKLEEFYTLYPSQPGREFLCRQKDKKKDVTHTSRPELECASFQQLSYSTSGTRCISGFALSMIGSRRNRKSAAPEKISEAPSADCRFMASMEEKIQVKRQRTETLVASLPGQSKKVRVVTFTQAQLPKAHVTETGGLLGMILFNDGQATFRQDNTTFVRALLMNSNHANIYNYSSTNK